MLYKHTVEPKLLEFLNKISANEKFSRFSLVGGTALALQIGHRHSIDLDFFSTSDFDHDEIIEELNELSQNVTVTKQSKNILITSVEGVKIDFVNYKLYPFIRNFVVEENIKMASKEDIAAMKLNAISNRGTKKDFIDLFFLMNFFTLSEMIQFYREKYSNHSEFGMIKSLTYFYEAEMFPQPKMYADFDWEECKEKMRQEFNGLKLF